MRKNISSGCLWYWRVYVIPTIHCFLSVLHHPFQTFGDLTCLMQSFLHWSWLQARRDKVLCQEELFRRLIHQNSTIRKTNCPTVITPIAMSSDNCFHSHLLEPFGLLLTSALWQGEKGPRSCECNRRRQTAAKHAKDMTLSLLSCRIQWQYIYEKKLSKDEYTHTVYTVHISTGKLHVHVRRQMGWLI